MSTLKATNLQHKDSSDPNVVLYADGSTSIRNLQNLTRSIIHNGECAVDQRGGTHKFANSQSPSGHFPVDRHKVRTLGVTYPSGDYMQTLQSTDVPSIAQAGTKFSNSFEIEVLQDMSNPSVFADQSIEGLDAAYLGWGTANAKTVTYSFWMKATKTGTFTVRISGSGSTDSYVTERTVATANVWQFYQAVIPGPTSGAFNTDNTGAFTIGITPSMDTGWIATSTLDQWISGNFAGSTTQDDLLLNDGDRIWVTGVQLTATDAPIEFQHEDYATTLAKCQRYYQKIGFKNNASIAMGFETQTSAYGTFTFVNEMRAAPDIIAAAASGFSVTTAAVSQVCDGFTADAGSSTTARVRFIHPSNTGFLAKGAALAFCNNDSAGISLSAEL